MGTKIAEIGKLVGDLRYEAKQAESDGSANLATILRGIATRFEEGAVHEDDDSAGIEREKAMVKAFEAIAASVEGIRVEMAKARGQHNVLPPFDSEGGMRVKT